MAKTLQNTVNAISAFVQLRPLTGVGGFANEPSLTIGDWCRNFILGPPFAWRWNRNNTAFSITQAGGQDYVRTLTDFGWIEKATISNAATTGLVEKELDVRLALGETSKQNEPTAIAAQLDDGAGKITFRLLPPPEQTYTLTVTYQKASPTFVALTDTWSPIPDYLSYLYNQGFVAKSYEMANDERFGLAMQVFMRQVIAANGGLSDSQLNIFMAERITTQREIQSKLGESQAGRTGRGLFQG